ncbi:GIY-YIG nuclease family protein [Pedobacter sp.]
MAECSDGSYDVGVTNDLEIRIEQHNIGYDRKANTFTRCPVVLRSYQRFNLIEQAIEFEKQLKGWSRKKKEALFNEDWDEVKRLSNLKKKI